MKTVRQAEVLSEFSYWNWCQRFCTPSLNRMFRLRSHCPKKTVLVGGGRRVQDGQGGEQGGQLVHESPGAVLVRLLRRERPALGRQPVSEAPWTGGWLGESMRAPCAWVRDSGTVPVRRSGSDDSGCVVQFGHRFVSTGPGFFLLFHRCRLRSEMPFHDQMKKEIVGQIEKNARPILDATGVLF